MATFAVHCSEETKARGDALVDLYKKGGEDKEIALLRIIALAESESIKGTHPELWPQLNAIDKTINILINQINNVVAGQDNQINDLTEKAAKANTDKLKVIEKYNANMADADALKAASEEAIKKAANDTELARTHAQEEIAKAKKEASMTVERSNIERDQAIRERDDYRTIAEEKTLSNDLLMNQNTAMQADIAAFKTLQESHSQLTADYSSIQAELAAKNRELADVKKEYDAYIKSKEADLAHQLELSKTQADLAAEKAANTTKEQLQREIRQTDKEAAKLSAQNEQLQAQIDNLIAQNEQLKMQIMSAAKDPN